MTHRPTGAVDLAYFESLPLWIAHYGVSQPLIPSPWDYAIFWQIGTPAIGLEYGAESLEIDMNYWYGSPESFRAYFGLGVPVPEPPTEPDTGATMKGTVLLGYTLNIRSATNTIIGTLKVNDVVYGNVTNNRIYYSQIYRSSGVVEVLDGLHSSAVSNGGTPVVYWMKLESVGEPVPPVPAEVTVKRVTVELSDGAKYEGSQFTKVG